MSGLGLDRIELQEELDQMKSHIRQLQQIVCERGHYFGDKGQYSTCLLCGWKGKL